MLPFSLWKENGTGGSCAALNAASVIIAIMPDPVGFTQQDGVCAFRTALQEISTRKKKMYFIRCVLPIDNCRISVTKIKPSAELMACMFFKDRLGHVNS